MRARLLIPLLVSLLAPPLGARADGATGLELSNRIVSVATAPGPTNASVVTFVGRSHLAVPEGVTVAPEFVLGDTATISPSAIPGVSPTQPYQYRFRATSLAAGEHQTRVDVRAGFSNVGWLSGVVAAGSQVRDGEQVESMVASVPPVPTTPPRHVTPGGALVWEPIRPVTNTIVSKDWDPQAGAFVIGGMRTVSAAAILRVDGGGLVATTEQTTEVLVPLPGYRSGIVFTVRQSKLPDIAYGSNLAVVDDGAGGKAMRVRITVPAGTRWPESGDEAPGGTWKLRIDVNAADLNGLPAGAAAQMELGLPEPEMVATYLHGDQEVVLPAAVRTRLAVDRSRAQMLDTLPWPRVETPTHAARARATDAAVACDGTPLRSTGVAEYQAPGALELCLDGGTGDVRMNGIGVGTVGVPYADVQGTRRPVEWIGGDRPNVYEYSYWSAADNYGSQFNMVLHGRAGTTEFDALLILTLSDDGGSVIPLIIEYRNHAPGGARLGWLIDADAGEGEELLAYGAAPLPVEATLATDGLSGLLAAQPAQVVAAPGSPVRHAITPWAALDFVIFRRDGSSSQELPAETLVAPPELLAGGDVAVYALTPLAADHSQWHGNRAPLVSSTYNAVPAQVRGAVNTGLAFGLLATGQTGLTYYHVIAGV